MDFIRVKHETYLKQLEDDMQALINMINGDISENEWFDLQYDKMISSEMDYDKFSWSEG